ncbi:MAG TPA: hypothetical protein PK373_01295, partial [Sedimentisphaerales bacterium]|nr:hypothetical protein [Sedimentisphaerales bacterium]
MKRTLCVGLLLACWVAPKTSSANPLDLAGTWSVELDRQDRGETDKWFERNLSAKVSLPGVLTAQGHGDPPSMKTPWVGNINQAWFNDPYYKQYQTDNNFKMPFWLQPDRYYAGAAWYQRQIEIPQNWKGKRIVLFLERPHWKTTVWLDGKLLGSNDSLGTPHEHELGLDVAAGRHRLTIRVDNRMIVPVGIDAHSASDHTQGNWNGIAGRIELRATDPVWIDDVRVYPNIDTGDVKVQVRVGNMQQEPGSGILSIAIEGRERVLSLPVTWTAEGGQATGTYPMGRVGDWLPWGEFSPVTYKMTVALQGGDYADQKTVSFG